MTAGTSAATPRDRMILLEGVRNFRDVGGYRAADGRRVRWGRVYRGGHLGRATPADVAVLTGLGIRTIFDLRSAGEIAVEGADAPIGAETISLSVSDPAAAEKFRRLLASGDEAAILELLGEGRAVAMVRRSYADEVVARTGIHRAILERIERDDHLPVLIHCAAGKDRAGWAAAVILLALGVDEATVMEDYLLSDAAQNRYRTDRVLDREARPSPAVQAALEPLLGVRPEYLDAAFASVRAEYGDIDRYLEHGLGLDPVRRARLQDRLLEP